ncbi:MAG TPA: hypothetical protein VJR06_05045 [Nitrososphaerales archaeon]|nr:hypothetical protein [Nitrososphaerales archaeon]
MKSTALLEITCIDPEVRKGLVSVLTPDNEGGPRGLRISLAATGRKLKVSIEAETPATAVSTCLAFLRDVALFQEIWLLSRTRRG